MQRIFYQDLWAKDKQLVVDDMTIVYQLVKVLRVKIWDRVLFFDWESFVDYEYEIQSIEKREIVFKYIKKIEKNNEIDFSLNLFQAIPNKIDKIEYIIQKWTEIWFSNFYFFNGERSLKFNLTDNKFERFLKIIIEAVEQSGRNIIPKIYFLDNIPLEELKEYKNIFFHTQEKDSKSLKDLDFKNDKKINIFVGPEWWFSEKEEKEFLNNNFLKVYLWKRILRTETTWMSVWFYIVQSR